MRPVDRGTLESMGREEEGREPVELVPVDEDVRFTEENERA